MAKTATGSTKKNGASRKNPPYNYLHVVRHDEGWAIRPGKNIRPRSVHKTRKEAVEVARALAEKNECMLVIHGRDNRVKAWNLFYKGPLPPKTWPKVSHSDTPPKTATKEAIRKAVIQAINERKHKVVKTKPTKAAVTKPESR